MQFEISFKTIYKEISPHFNSLLFVKGYFNTLTLTKPMARRDHLIFTVMLNFKGPTLQLVYHIKIGRQISTAIYTKFKSSDSNLTPCNLNSPKPPSLIFSRLVYCRISNVKFWQKNAHSIKLRPAVMNSTVYSSAYRVSMQAYLIFPTLYVKHVYSSYKSNLCIALFFDQLNFFFPILV